MSLVELSQDELAALIGAVETVDAEYGFGVYPNDGVPNGSHGPRTPAQHRAAYDAGEVLLERLDNALQKGTVS